LLLPFLARHGFDWSGDALREVREKHEHVGWLVEAFCQGVESVRRPDRDGQRRLAATAAALASRQRGLSASQDLELFPEVMTRLDPDSLGRLHDELVDFDDRSGAPVTELSTLLRRLVAVRHAGSGPFGPRGSAAS
jgi:hypothetical protein